MAYYMKLSLCILFCCALVQADSLVASLFGYWNMNGNFQDSSGNNRHATVSGSVATTSTGVREGMSASFSGSSYLSLGNIWAGGNTDLTMSCWFKTNQVGLGTGANLGYGTIGIGNTGTRGHFYARVVGPGVSGNTGGGLDSYYDDPNC